MLIKSADDQTRRLQLLEALLSSPRLDRWQKDKLRDHLQRKKTGMQGERDAAHYIDTHLREGDNHAVLHDLRFKIDGVHAQIDHLIIGRGFHFYLLETKNFGGNLRINEVGEFTAEYGREKYGIESPLEQSRRHETMFLKLLDELGISGRFAQRPRIFHAVLLNPRAIIMRPSAKSFDTTMIMKADQFDTWRKQAIDAMPVPAMLQFIANLVSTETIVDWGKSIARRHCPGNPLELPDWLKPQPEKATPPPTVKSVLPARQATPPPYLAKAAKAVTPIGEKPALDSEARKQLICATCSDKISYAEGKFCWNNEKRFAGLQYCREHQKAL